MKKAPLRLVTALMLALGISSTAAAGQLFDNFYFFGDSLTDMGNANGAPVTSGGSTWANYFANKFNNQASPSNSGGNDYAQAGALTAMTTAQFNNYIANNKVDPHALYSIWAGANDINALLEFESPSEIINIGVGNINTIVQGLHNAGAKYIMVFNLPDLGETPLGQYQGAFVAGILSQVSQAYNSVLSSTLNADGFDVIQIDIYSLLNDLFANPQHFGLASFTDLFYTPPGGNPAQDEHPTGYGHQMIADYAFSVVEGPTRAAILAMAPFSVMDGQDANIENQLYNVRTRMSRLAVGQTTVFGSSSYTPFRQDSQGTQSPGFDGHSVDLLSAGIIHRINNNLVAGIGLAHTFGRVNFGQHGGSFSMNENIASAFGGYQYNEFYADGILSYGLIDFNHVKRNIKIGVSQNAASGQTNGSQFGADLIAGYNIIDKANLQTGPLVNTDYQNIRVNAYAESGTIGGIAEQFDNQNNDALTSGLGWQLAYTFDVNNTPVMPFAQVTYNHQWLKGDRDVGAGLVSIPGSHFTIPIPRASGTGNDFALANAGVSVNLSRNVNLSFGYATTLFLSGGRMQNVNANIQIGL